MNGIGTKQVWRRVSLAFSAFLALLSVAAPAPSSAAETPMHTFDASLSLTGGTEVSKLDPVSDPGPDHPSEPFLRPCAVATDSAGDTYVASFTADEGGRIDVFNSEGIFLTEIPNSNGPCGLAVDAAGVLYVAQEAAGARGIVRYKPDSYPLDSSTTYSSPTTIYEESVAGIAVDQLDGHVFAAQPSRVLEFSSATEGNTLLRSDIGQGILSLANGIAVDAKAEKIFVGTLCQGCSPIGRNSVIDIFDLDGNLLEVLDGAELPVEGHEFKSEQGILYPAVDEQTGELFVNDVFQGSRVYRFVPSGDSYVFVADPELESHSYSIPSRIAVANGESDPVQGTVYVTAGQKGHLYAFPQTLTSPPVVGDMQIRDVGVTEAGAAGSVNPQGAVTEYKIEYVTDEAYANEGFANPAIGASGSLSGGSQEVEVSASLAGLEPGTIYRIRLSASSHCHPQEPEQLCVTFGDSTVFATYPAALDSGPCPNASLRVGASAALPDCRAYELVTPPDTNGQEPAVKLLGNGNGAFETQLATTNGENLLFMTVGGALPGLGGNGVADGYQAVRTSSGWTTQAVGPAGSQSQAPAAGGASEDHSYWFWSTGSATDNGSLVINDARTDYVRTPDGQFSLIGRGPEGTDPTAEGRWIAAEGSHLIFDSSRPLTADSPPEGTVGIYDRTPDGVTRLLSVDVSGAAFDSSASYQGVSRNGEAVAFQISEEGVKTLYEHRLGVTMAVTQGTTTFAGLSNDGGRLTYVRNGNIFSFDAASGESQAVGSGGESVPVNVSGDGSHVYFVSPKTLAAGAKAGQENFYVWSAQTGQVSLIAIIDPIDVSGVTLPSKEHAYGLGEWVEGVGPQQQGAIRGPANDPSRTSSDGRTIVFESRASLTGYDSEGNVEVYRYEEEGSPSLTCVSCSPALTAATGDAHIQVLWGADSSAPTNAMTPIHSLTDDGQRVFFQTPDPLVPTDIDQTDDVYEWMAHGVGGCSRAQGCVALISLGRSSEPNYLYAVTPSGNDVFFSSADRLLAVDQDVARSIYDARVNGGFPEGAPPVCTGDACKGESVASPVPPTRATAINAEGSPKTKRCRKGQRKVKRHGMVRCVKKHRHKHHRHGKGGAR